MGVNHFPLHEHVHSLHNHENTCTAHTDIPALYYTTPQTCAHMRAHTHNEGKTFVEYFELFCVECMFSAVLTNHWPVSYSSFWH